MRWTIADSDNGLSPGRRQAIIWTNAGILFIGPCGTNFSEILIGIQTFSFKKRHLKMSSAKWRLFCLGLNVLKLGNVITHPCLTTIEIRTWMSKRITTVEIRAWMCNYNYIPYKLWMELLIHVVNEKLLFLVGWMELLLSCTKPSRQSDAYIHQ